MTKKPVLADIDGSTPGRAALVAVKLNDDDHDPMVTGFVETEDRPDPIKMAYALKASVEDDFPEHVWAVVANERARFLTWCGRMRAVLGSDYAPDSAEAQQNYLDL